MITQLQIQNFKSWRDSGAMRFAPLTGFFGANSSGKTSILQFLLMLKQTAESLDRSQVLNLGDERSYVNLGTFTDIAFNHMDTNPISFQLAWLPGLQQQLLNHFNWFTTKEPLRFSAQFELIRQIVTLQHFTYAQGPSSVGMELQRPAFSEQAAQYVVINDSTLEPRNGATPNVSAPTYFYAFPEALNLHYQDTFLPSWLTSLFDNLLGSIEYLGPLREYPSRTYLLRGSKIGSIGSRGERTIPALLTSSPNVQEAVAYWLKELGLINSFTLRPVAEGRHEYELRIRQSAQSPEVFVTDVGFGVSQILPVLTLCSYAAPGSIIILEQPEIHLHPAVQAGLADVFITAIKERNIQIILESHSEHLLRRLQRRMAEEQLHPEDVALYFVTMQAGQSHIETLQVDSYGNISNWPQNFFGDEMGDLVAMTEAVIMRQQQNGA
ncbi:MAG: DUF3696 domain-containing protein [Caldilineaceae bacterium]